jgi:hypothetical protein
MTHRYLDPGVEGTSGTLAGRQTSMPIVDQRLRTPADVRTAVGKTVGTIALVLTSLARSRVVLHVVIQLKIDPNLDSAGAGKRSFELKTLGIGALGRNIV